MMAKHYIYRIDHDLGFAPNPDYGICTLCGCKRVIERGATTGSWVIGIGGNNSHRPNKLIYAMQVEAAFPYAEFRARYKQKSRYLEDKKGIGPAKRVLFSRKFFYFGNKAIDLPQQLQHIIIHAQGCKLVSDEDAAGLEKYLLKRYDYGKYGRPNNAKKQEASRC
jgi:hypothetical protein